ncbi:MAG: VOC family protein [Caulobacter sp.]|nr:VOC family protein [Caulobacter sp.]
MSETDHFHDRALNGARFTDCALAGARFEDVNLATATFSNATLRDARLTNVDLSGVEISDANIAGLTIMGHDVSALIAAEEAGPMVAEPQLFVADLDAALAFYVERLGFFVAFTHGQPATYAQVRRGGWRLNLRKVAGPVLKADFRGREPDALAATLTLRDARKLFEAYSAAGLTFSQPLRREPWGAMTFIVEDPAGNLIAFAGDAQDQE